MVRGNICLNGEWDFMPVYGTKACLDLPGELIFEEQKIRVPSSWRYVLEQEYDSFGKIGEFEPYHVFGYPREWSSADTGLYRRSFIIPENMAGERLYLRFDGIMQRSRIYLNDEPLIDWEEAYLPLKLEITDRVLADGSENVLTVVCTTFEEAVISSGSKRSLGLSGSWFGSIGRGIWQDVYLECCPIISVEDVFIKTSFRKRSISAQLKIENISPSQRNILVRAVISDSGSPVKELPQTMISLEKGQCKRLSMEETWTDAILWTPEHPHLYCLTVSLMENEKILDRKSVRFGFREIWTEGHIFMLNGIRINLRGDSWHFQGAAQMTKEYALNWFAMCRMKGLNFVRLHAEPHPELYLEAADEAGMLIVDETAIYGSGKAMSADHPIYLDRCKRHVKRLVQRDRNHPCIIIWSLENEMRWVEGRDIYKLHIPAMMEMIRNLDGTRPILLEGDNRLLPKDQNDIESYHYNIDGTIGQWDRKRPLMFGEHGGWWYVCPQNSSAYIGLKAYDNSDESVRGMALKEKLYVEYGRKSEVSGITSFNFAHYLMKSMPDEDIGLTWERLDTPGCKPEVIRKHSLTINNGYLKEYPLFRQNPGMDILEEAYKPVTVIPSEYNSSFYDSADIERSFCIYNDTLENKCCRLEVSAIQRGNSTILTRTLEFYQEAGEKKEVTLTLKPMRVTVMDESESLDFEAVLYHEEIEVYRLKRTYKIYSAMLKTEPVIETYRQEKNGNGKTTAYKSGYDAKTDSFMAFYGNDRDFDIIARMLPGVERIDKLDRIYDYDLCVLGSYLNENAENCQEIMERFVNNGKVLCQLEQFKIAPGDLSLVKQSFFSTHIGDRHAILKGLEDEDLIFWSPYTREETPENIILQCFLKPVTGDVKMLLECSAGDFGDGGDLWTPLVEIGYYQGTAIFNQLEIMENYKEVPQACLLLRNMLQYAVGLKKRKHTRTAVISDSSRAIDSFIKKLEAQIDFIHADENLSCYGNLVVDINGICGSDLDRIKEFTVNGGNVLLLPLYDTGAEMLRKLLQKQVNLFDIPSYHLKKACNDELLLGISPVDLFRYEKVPCSPRLVENHPVCSNAIEIEESDILLEGITGTPWHDYFVENHSDEYSRIALVDINKENYSQRNGYLVRTKIGRGNLITSQLSCNPENEKDVRIYSRLIANLGTLIDSSLFSYRKNHRDYAVDCMMAMPHGEYNDYETSEAYYTDENYTLNNLGEGLYGWMTKIEKAAGDGFINLKNSGGQRYFLTCFTEYLEDRTYVTSARESETTGKEEQEPVVCTLDIDTNVSIRIWINGALVCDHKQASQSTIRVKIDRIVLRKGCNRFVIATEKCNSDIRLRPVFKETSGAYLMNLGYRMTLDEVDPK